MVNYPKRKKTFCPFPGCRCHTEHKVSQYKKGQDRKVSLGTRRYKMKQKGFGGQTKPVFKKKAKTTKIISVKLQCTKCKKVHQLTIGRTKHFELAEKKKGSKKDVIF